MGRIVSGGRDGWCRRRRWTRATSAAALLAAARADADAIRARAAADRDEAVRQGRDQGRAEAAAEMAALLAEARAHAARLREAATPAAIALATKMAEQIVGRAVTLAPEVMADIAGAALDACRPRGDWVRVRVHPDDAAAVIARRDALAGRAPPAAALEIVGRRGRRAPWLRHRDRGRTRRRAPGDAARRAGARAHGADAWLTSISGKAFARLEAATPRRESGRVTEVTGLVIRASVPGVRVGEVVNIASADASAGRRGDPTRRRCAPRSSASAATRSC